MSLFVESVWYAAVDASDASNTRAKAILTRDEPFVCTDHVLVETWTMLRSTAMVEPVGTADLAAAWQIGLTYRDQDFSLVDRTSFAVMCRLGIDRAASFDDHFAVFRFGPKRRHALEIVG